MTYTRNMTRSSFDRRRTSSQPGRGFSPRGNNRPRFNRKDEKLDPAMLVRKAENQIVADEFKAVHTFDGFEINQILKSNITAHGYVSPTPIQDQVIPAVLLGKDVVGIANTGTGKTAAFLIPLIHKLSLNNREKLLIVAPTRELAVQIQDEVREFSRGMNIFSSLCIGGVNIHRQVQELRRNPNIVVGTPGRLKDLKTQGKLPIPLFNTIVLDEVDRMLDMGFIHDVKYILSNLPKRRQSLFFSATVSPVIKNIIDTFANQPVTISVKLQETATNVDQDIVKTFGKGKLEVLHDLLRNQEMKKVIIFGRTKFGIEKLARQLLVRGLPVVALHGNKNQNQRMRVLDQFRNNKVPILLATDVVSRGLDIDDVTHVINYDLPGTYEDYVHRIGRTGRNNKKGIALSFVD